MIISVIMYGFEREDDGDLLALLHLVPAVRAVASSLPSLPIQDHREWYRRSG
jgi:hypothetical protein